MKKIVLGLIIFCSSIFADKITIFAASDLKFALDDIKKEFLKENKNDEIEMIYGSSGKGMHQIENGAPFDIFFSANMGFVEKLYKQGDVTSKPKMYALGRVVIWSNHKSFDSSKGFENLKEPWIKKIAIANPTHAPYGEKAKQAMESLNIYNTLKREIVFRYIKDLNPNKRNIMFFKESEDIILSTVAEIIIDKLLDEDFRTKITELIDTDIGDDGSYEIYTCDE